MRRRWALAVGWWAAGCAVLLALAPARADDAKEMTLEEKKLSKEAKALNDRGVELYGQGKYVEATKAVEQALSIRRKLYSKEKYPQGHPELAESVNNLGFLLQARGDYTRAEPLLREVLGMQLELYPKESYPQGHSLLAATLGNLGDLLRERGDYAAAEPLLRESLDMRRALHPKDKYPQGHPDLARSFSNLGILLHTRGDYAGAEPLYSEAVGMYRALYPKAQYPHGHRDLTASVNNLGMLLKSRGDYAGAEPLLREVLEMRRALYPKEKYPQGHPDVALGFDNLGMLFQERGDYARAEPLYREALEMRRALFPKENYPNCHPLLARSVNNLGFLLEARRDYAEAEPFFREAVRMCRELYPKEKYPHGHPALASSVSNLAVLLDDREDYAGAEPLCREALEMRRVLFPKKDYPHGQPELALSLNNLGALLYVRGDYAGAEPLGLEALEMYRALYPREKYLQGHPALARSINYRAFLLNARGDYARAEPVYRESLEMYSQLAGLFALGAPEAQALNYAAISPLTRDAFLSVTAHLPSAAATTYAACWRNKALLTRVYERRHLALLAAAVSPEVNELWRQLLEVRRQRERLLLAPLRANPTARDRELTEVDGRIDTLERELLPRLPDLARSERVAASTPAGLQKALPADAALIDLLRYTFFEQDPKIPGKKGERRNNRYLAFIVTRERIERVELGAARPIDDAVVAWRDAITAWSSATTDAARRDVERRAAAHAETLHALVWAKLAARLPAEARVVYLAPDAALTQVPWAALPGRRKGTVLLEDHAVAVVPHGPFLLDRLTAPARSDKAPRGLLAIGGVRYDDMPVAPGRELLAARGADAAVAGALTWDYLAGTERELKQVTALAKGRQVRKVSGAEAGADRLLAELPQVRYAHLATHGFFADKTFRSVLQLDEKLFERREFLEGRIGERIGEGARSPLVLSGLVMAGANRKETPGRGIVTADAIAGLNLTGLDLAVLSACETGLGDVAGGEGVYGLQRAFHIAGARDVVGSLWRVNDEATAALMALFYRYLWEDKLPSVEALRAAQLAVYRQPDKLAAWAKGERGPDLKQAKVPATPLETPVRATVTAPVNLWAAFLLSGPGR
jgi:CHAT domain-containing protein/Flp pilus assembly protein TadD